MRDQAIRNAHADYANFVLKSVLLKQLQHRRSKAAGEIRFFNRHDQTLGAGEREQ